MRRKALEVLWRGGRDRGGAPGEYIEVGDQRLPGMGRRYEGRDSVIGRCTDGLQG